MEDLIAHANDFADTAGLISLLDLVITVDTSVAHLAGALGKPVWVLVPANPDWRWLLERSDSPWYLTMRLFRRGAGAEWGDVVARLRDALRMTFALQSANRGITYIIRCGSAVIDTARYLVSAGPVLVEAS